MIDSGSVYSIITKTLVNNLLKTTPTARWIAWACEKDLKSPLKEPIKVPKKIATKASRNDWICEDACLTVVDDGHKFFIGRGLFSSL